MLIIKKISELIDDELEDAEKYAKCALKYDVESPEVAEVFDSISRQEMHHVDMLHEVGVKLIREYEAKGNSIPADMQAVYNYLHEKHIEKASKIKDMQMVTGR